MARAKTNHTLIRPPVDHDVIEALMDRHDTKEVLAAIALVLAEKAAHLRSTWQDHDMADLFDEASEKVSGVAINVERLIG